MIAASAVIVILLATVLWLSILQRAGVAMSPWRFAAIGLVVTPPALIAAALLAR